MSLSFCLSFSVVGAKIMLVLDDDDDAPAADRLVTR